MFLKKSFEVKSVSLLEAAAFYRRQYNLEAIASLPFLSNKRAVAVDNRKININAFNLVHCVNVAI